MQKCNERYREGNVRYDGFASRSAGSSDKHKNGHKPPRRNNQRERNAEFDCQFERGAVHNIPYPEDRNISATVCWENRGKCSQSGAKPRIVSNYPQGRLIGRKPPLLDKSLRIDARLNIAAEKLEQY